MGVGDAAQYTSLRSPGGDFPAVKLLKSIGHSNLQGRSGMGKPKRIGVLTSGGDCAGLNAALRAVVLRAAGHYGWDVIGIRNGTAGILERPVAADILQLEPGPFDGPLLPRGGPLPGPTKQGDPFKRKAPAE